MRKIATSACFIAVFALVLVGQAPTKKELQEALSPEGIKKFQAERSRLYQWDPFKFLMGKWKTDSAGFDVALSLDGKVLVFSNTEPSMALSRKGKATNYRSLTYVYLEGLTPRATTYDNEGGVFIEDIEVGQQKLSFVRGTTPRVRLTFQENKQGAVSVAVESAPTATAQFKPQAAINAIRVSQ